MENTTRFNSDEVAEIKVVREDGRPAIKVFVPRGTPFSKTARLHGQIDKLIERLTGCQPCNSGVPIFIQEHDFIERIFNIDLGTMEEIR